MSAKRTLEEPQPADRPVKKKLNFPMAELYKPTMVTIVVSNAAVVADGEMPDEEEFLLPRALVAMQSKYFDNVFKGRFAERKTGRSVLDDVSPWVFRCFVGCVFVPKIFYDDARVEPSELGEVDPGDRVQETEKTLPETSVRKQTDLTLVSVTQSDKSHEKSTGLSSFLDESLPEAQVSGPARDQQKVPDTVDITSDAHRDEDEDPNDPVTWNWLELFELYVFSEKYDSRSFRMAIFDAIQLKLMQKRPVAFSYPSVSALTYISQNVPATSKLLRLLAKQWQSQEFTFFSKAFHRQVEILAKLPSAFTAACFVQARREVATLRCRHCGEFGDGGKCGRKDHSRFDDSDGWRIHACFYHEHGDDVEERDLCTSKWNKRYALICDEQVQGNARPAVSYTRS